jgi:hypothetical protein
MRFGRIPDSQKTAQTGPILMAGDSTLLPDDERVPERDPFCETARPLHGRRWIGLTTSATSCSESVGARLPPRQCRSRAAKASNDAGPADDGRQAPGLSGPSSRLWP